MNDCLRLVVTSRLQEPALGLLGDAVLSLLFSLLDRCRLPVSSSITDHPYQQQQCPSDPVQTLVGHVNHHRVDYSSNRQIGTKSYKTQALYRSHRPVDRACIPNTAQIHRLRHPVPLHIPNSFVQRLRSPEILQDLLAISRSSISHQTQNCCIAFESFSFGCLARYACSG